MCARKEQEGRGGGRRTISSGTVSGAFLWASLRVASEFGKHNERAVELYPGRNGYSTGDDPIRTTDKKGGKVTQPCGIVSVASVLLAVAQEDVERAQISSRIRPLFDVVYSWVKGADVLQAGNNYAVYDRCTPERLRLQVGFPVSGTFADTDGVKCIELEAGRAAHATHVGSYEDMHVTNRALTEWCTEQGLSVTGDSWEVYGDWHDDPSKVTTDIYFRVR